MVVICEILEMLDYYGSIICLAIRGNETKQGIIDVHKCMVCELKEMEIGEEFFELTFIYQPVLFDVDCL
jgi:hypothetical protein